MAYRKLWLTFAIVVVVSFAVLGWFGREIYRQAPPVPDRIVTTDGRVLFTGDDIRDGQNVWQSTGGQELGLVWGHGAYVAPDWSADWLHREAVHIRDQWAREDFSREFAALGPEEQAALEARLQGLLRRNTYDPQTGDLVVSAERAAAMSAVADHYRSLFGDDPALADLRESYAMRTPTVEGADRLDDLTAFFFWAAWACVTERPGSEVTYSNNWPPDATVGNRPTGALILWTGFSVILLLAGIAALAGTTPPTARTNSTRPPCRARIP